MNMRVDRFSFMTCIGFCYAFSVSDAGSFLMLFDLLTKPQSRFITDTLHIDKGKRGMWKRTTMK